MGKVLVFTLHGVSPSVDGTKADYAKRFCARIGNKAGVRGETVFWSDTVHPSAGDLAGARLVVRQLHYSKLLRQCTAISSKYRTLRKKQFLRWERPQWRWLQRSLANFAIDAFAYQNTPGVAGGAQEEVLSTLSDTVGTATQQFQPQAVVFVGVSLGVLVGVDLLRRLEGQASSTPQHQAWKKTRRFATFGCNLPLLVAGKAEMPYFKAPEAFRWDNYFDADDALGFPLRPLSRDHDALGKLAPKDHRIQTGATPKAHADYFDDRSVQAELAKQLESLL